MLYFPLLTCLISVFQAICTPRGTKQPKTIISPYEPMQMCVNLLDMYPVCTPPNKIDKKKFHKKQCKWLRFRMYVPRVNGGEPGFSSRQNWRMRIVR